MKKVVISLTLLMLFICFSGFKYEESEDALDNEVIFSVDDLYDYQKAFAYEEIELCADNATKTYMDYRATTARDSKQYWFIRDEMTVDNKTGFLYDQDGFIGVALGSYFGGIGERYYFTLETGIVLPLVKCEEKSDSHTDPTHCYHALDGSIIEFVIDTGLAMEYFGKLSNNYILNGNFNNYSLFNGKIVKVEKVLEDKNEIYVTYGKNLNNNLESKDIYNYASGY